ncbi:MAG: 3-deoxy-7-phosphoheptulonate synthase, partial [Pirellulales bacterium]|nr:3-deoxy-7-phosphoheptulonate synthase [Pirellulales bacterium]
MIIVMKHTATEADIETMIGEVEAKGLKPTVIRGTERTVIAAVGEERVAGIRSLESGPGVDEVLPIVAPYKLASRELKPESSTIT